MPPLRKGFLASYGVGLACVVAALFVGPNIGPIAFVRGVYDVLEWLHLELFFLPAVVATSLPLVLIATLLLNRKRRQNQRITWRFALGMGAGVIGIGVPVIALCGLFLLDPNLHWTESILINGSILIIALALWGAVLGGIGWLVAFGTKSTAQLGELHDPKP